MHTENAGKFATEPAHAAFEPVAAVIGYEAGDGFNESGAVLAQDGHDKRNLHGRSVVAPSAADKRSVWKAPISKHQAPEKLQTPTLLRFVNSADEVTVEP
jgi:hypothetical protein